ncbi:MAG: InlB B-repeat-containing protein [Eubacterium coprostanoligenes]|uniref:InlB B-repeat-containing protein n=1 Tax=Eubacterium coprostanoligenes TaxID=290054 RepID=UPI002355FA7E|nr:InlB B-repeat-containing protein [Eubacterium coprostanoligenes]MCI7265037.1 InlB B-repeat-containing protein [Eubacterium coprostanoligenes]MDD6665099.1 InlB B-repeat-containing protein [Eubacterium coprostanoligenes]
MEDNNTMSLNTERKPGGLYRNVKMSVKTADRLILIGIIVLIACMIFAVSHAGFTVTFNTDGGSQIENQKVMYGQLVEVEENPVKEGYTFTGWYTDKDCKNQFDVTKDKVSDSITLYSGWEKK